MKRSILIFFSLSFLFVFNVKAQDEKEITTVLYQQASAWNAGSVEDFMKGYWNDDSLMYVGSRGVTYGYKNILSSYKKAYPDTAAMGKLHFDILHVKRLSPEYYYVVGKFTLTRSKGDASGHFTLVFKRINGRWLVISDHSS